MKTMRMTTETYTHNVATLGTNQSGMRAYNEKIVLTMIRRNGAMAKADIAKLTGLSAQTVSVIMRALEDEGLLIKGIPLRGKVGQPSVPMSLNPSGALFFGLKIGRRSAEVILTDFLGNIMEQHRLPYHFPTADAIMKFVDVTMVKLLSNLTADQRKRISGMGIAMPFEIWNWAELINLKPEQMSHWRERNIASELAAKFDFPIYIQNDASAACGAELIFGDQNCPSNFLYFYIGYFVGGGVVLGDQLYTGGSGNAGAIGSMPVHNFENKRCQLIETSSIAGLEIALQNAGIDSELIWDEEGIWDFPPEIIENWIDQNAYGLAQASLAAAAVIDFQAVLIDGWLPDRIRARIVEHTADHYVKLDQSGLTPLDILSGTIGINARPLGAASLPLSARYIEGVAVPEAAIVYQELAAS